MGAEVKLATNWIMGDIAAYLKNEKLSISEIKLTPKELAELIASIKSETISGKIGKEVGVCLHPSLFFIFEPLSQPPQNSLAVISLLMSISQDYFHSRFIVSLVQDSRFLDTICFLFENMVLFSNFLTSHDICRYCLSY